MLVNIDTPARLLRLLVLFSTRSSWSAQELTDRLEVTPRTLRRDVTRLRDLGYPIESTTGRYGGYALGAGGRLPPLLLDDDEAVAVTVGLRELSRTADPMLGEAAVAALTKLVQVMPSALRERVDTLGEVTVRLGRADIRLRRRPADRRRRADGAGRGLPAPGAPALRLPHRRRAHRPASRRAAPPRVAAQPLVPRRVRPRPRRLADVPRRPHRPAGATGVRSAERPVPDAAALVAEGVAVRVYDTQARVRLPVPPAVAAREIAPDHRRHRARSGRCPQHDRRHRRRRRLDRPLPGRACRSRSRCSVPTRCATRSPPSAAASLTHVPSAPRP